MQKPVLAPLLLLALLGCSTGGGGSSTSGGGSAPLQNNPGGSNQGGNQNGGGNSQGNPLIFSSPRASNQLPPGSPNPTRFVRVPLANGSTIATVVGYRSGAGSGRVVALPSSGNVSNTVSIAPNGSGNVTSINDPFAITRINPTGTFEVALTDQVGTPSTGRLLQLSGVSGGSGAYTQLGGATLRGPIDVTSSGGASGLFVAEYRALNDGGDIRRFNPGNQSFDVYATGLSFPSSVLFVQDGVQRFLYVAENGTGAASGPNGGVLRIDLDVFLAGSNVTTAGGPTNGVTFIQPRAGEAAHNHPFDLEVDTNPSSLGDVVFTEGLTIDLTSGTLSQQGAGALRAISCLNSGTRSERDRSRIIQSGLTAPRGPWMSRVNLGDEIAVVFSEGLGSTCTVRWDNFNFGTNTASNATVLASNQNTTLDTLVEILAIDPNTLAVTAALKFITNFNVPNSGQVVDIRQGP